MGEAKIKLDARTQQATRIVEAFETFIDELIFSALRSQGLIIHTGQIDDLINARKGLIRALVEPPPKA